MNFTFATTMKATIKAYAILLVLILPVITSAQQKSDDAAIDHMRVDVRFLSDDKLKGRETGTEGERLAADHIAARFAEVGLTPMGDENSFRQEFSFNATPELGASNKLQLGRVTLKPREDFYPVSFSASGSVLGKLTNCLYRDSSPGSGI